MKKMGLSTKARDKKISNIEKNVFSQKNNENYTIGESVNFEQAHSFQQSVGNQVFREHLLQAKLRINKPGDKYEKEADRVADLIVGSDAKLNTDMSSTDQVVQKKGSEGEAAEEQCRECSEEDNQTEVVQLKTKSFDNPGLIERSDINYGAGQSMPGYLRGYFEPRFGHDFSGVSIHNDQRANESAAKINARAFTTGNRIVFGRGEYSPNTHNGRHLIAHELTHVLQQNGGNTYSAKSNTSTKENSNTEHSTSTIKTINNSDKPVVQRQQSTQSVAGMSQEEKWEIVYESAVYGLGDGLVMAMIIILGFILLIALAAAIVGFLCPLCIAAIESFLAATILGASVATWLTAILGSIGAGLAIETLRTSFMRVNREVTSAQTVDDLRAAGRNWGEESGGAIIEIIGSLMGLSSRVRTFVRNLSRRLPGSRGGNTPPNQPNVAPIPALRVPRRMPWDEALEWARRIRGDSEWLRRLSQIKRIDDIAERFREINNFIDAYRSATGTRIITVPRDQAGGYGLTGGNWGTYDEASNQILMHEDIYTLSYVDEVEQIAHEVGAAELNRLYGVLKENIPQITGPRPPGKDYLTHVIDMFL